jgi:hypothetical protein
VPRRTAYTAKADKGSLFPRGDRENPSVAEIRADGRKARDPTLKIIPQRSKKVKRKDRKKRAKEYKYIEKARVFAPFFL